MIRNLLSISFIAFLISFSQLLSAQSGDELCQYSVETNDVSCFNQANGSATIDLSNFRCDNTVISLCREPEVQTVDYCSGATLSSTDNVKIEPGQNIALESGTYNSIVLKGGQIVICSGKTVTITNFNYESDYGQLIIEEGATLNLNDLNISYQNTVILNYGTIVANNINTQGTFYNHNLVSILNNLNMNGNASLFENTGTVTVGNAFNNYFQVRNYNYISVNNDFHNNGSALFTNYCTLEVGENGPGLMINDYIIHNYGIINSFNLSRINGSSVLYNHAGSYFESKDVQNQDAAIIGDNSDCSQIVFTGNVTSNSSSSYSGNLHICGHNLETEFAGTYDPTVVNSCNCPTVDGKVTGPTPIEDITILWSNGSTEPSIANLTPGTYSFTLSCDGCNISDEVTISQPTELVALGEGVHPATNVSLDGSATVSTSGGTAPYTYLWSNGATTQNITNLGPGTYTVTVTDNNLCTDETTVVLIVDECKYSVTHQDVSCFGGNNAEITIDLTEWLSTSPTITWSNGATGITNNNLIANEYSFVIENETCRKTGIVEISSPTEIIVTATGTNVSAVGATDGSVSASASGGIAPYTYVWSNGETNSFIQNLAEGDYTVTVTDANLCSKIASVTITEPNPCGYTFATNDISCFGNADGSISVVLEDNSASVSWNNGFTGLSQSNLTEGQYSFTVSNTGCSNSELVYISRPDELIVSFAVEDESVAGALDGSITTTVSGGTGLYTFSWSNGQTTQHLNSLTEGDYTLTLTDQNGCVVSATAHVGVITPCSYTYSSTNETCPELNDGTITVIPFDESATITWSTGYTGTSIQNLEANDYSFTISNTGCSESKIVSISQPDVIQLAFDKQDVSEVDATDGYIEVFVTNPDGGNYEYEWSNGALVPLISNQPAGMYTVTVTNSEGCRVGGVEYIYDPNYKCAFTYVATNISCFGAENGEISVTPLNETSTITWSNGGTGTIQTGLSPIEYSFTVSNDGCSETEIVEITQPLQLDFTAQVTDASAETSLDGAIDITPSGGTLPYFYNWSNGAIAEDISGITQGWYTLVITDANGCSITKTIEVRVEGECDYTFTSTNNQCFGDASGTIEVILSDITSTITWSNHGTGVVQTGLAAQEYSFTVSNVAAECSKTQIVEITQPNDIDIYFDITPVSGIGLTDGAVTTSVSGGTGSYTFSWSHGPIVKDVGGIGVGEYILTVTDANGCTQTATATIGIRQCRYSFNKTDITCSGENNGSVSLNLSYWQGTANILWSNGSTDQNISGLSQGEYSLTLSGNQCNTVYEIVTINEPIQIISGHSSTPVTTENGNDGTASVNPSGGTAPYTYLWETGAQTPTISGLVKGFYAVAITDANGCSITDIIEVEEPDCIYNISKTDATCHDSNNGSITLDLSGWKGTPEIQWSNGSNQSMLTDLPPVQYSLVLGSGQCETITTEVTINAPSRIDATSQSTPDDGSGNGTATIAAFGGTPEYQYNWETGASVASISGLNAGTYLVNVIDENMCSEMFEVEVGTSVPGCTYEISHTDVTCNGDEDGTITLDLTNWAGTPVINWSNGSTESVVSGLKPMTYSLSLSSELCEEIRTTIEIAEPASIIPNESSTPEIHGFDGTASVDPIGGVAPYSYWWETAAIVSSISGLQADTYDVTITDAKGCSTTTSIEVGRIIPECQYSINYEDARCHDSNDGSISLDLSQWESTPAILWSNSNTGTSINNLEPGNYSVTFGSDQCATVTELVTITAPEVILPNELITHVTTAGGSDGAINLFPSGGTSPYQFSWFNQQTSSTISGLAKGDYSVTITDNNGCSITPILTVDEVITHEECAYEIYKADVTCFDAQNGTIGLNLSSWTSIPVISWNTGSGLPNISALDAGIYDVTFGSNECPAVHETIEIKQPDILVANESATDVTTVSGNDGTASVTPTGGTEPYSIEWENGAIASTISGLIAGTYSANITDANGCSVSATVTVNDPDPLCGYDIEYNDVTCFDGNDGTISISFTTFAGTPVIRWSNGSTESSISGLVANTYSVEIYSESCTTRTEIVEINQPAKIEALTDITHVTLPETNNGAVRLYDINGGTAPYSFAWSTGAAADVISNLTAGTYTVDITDVEGCTITKTAIVEEIDPKCTLRYTKEDITCFNGTDGSISLDLSQWESTPVINWSNGSSANSIDNLTAGTYSVAVSSSLCEEQNAEITISEPADIYVSLITTDATSLGGNDGTARINTISGGTPPYRYKWSTGAEVDNIAGLVSGNYDITVTDNKGCYIIKPFSIGEENELCRYSISSTNPQCNAGEDGSINIDLSAWLGGTPVIYWNTGSTDENLSGLTAGNYSVSISSAQCSTKHEIITLTEPEAIVFNSSSTDATVGNNDGTASVSNIQGGTGTYTINWSNGAAVADIQGLAQGTYQVTVTDQRGCYSTDEVEIDEYDPRCIIGISKSDIDCYGNNNGTINLDLSSYQGTPVISWSNGTAYENQTNLRPGRYSVIISSEICEEESRIITIEEPAQLSATASSTNVTSEFAADGTATVSVYGGTQTYRYAWSNRTSVKDIVGLPVGNYTVTVTDQHGCTATSTTTVGYNPCAYSVNTTDISCQGGNNGSIELTFTNWEQTPELIWDNGTEGTILSNLSEGSYTFTATTEQCNVTETISISEPSPISITFTTTNLTGSSSNDGSATATVSGGTPDYEYSWSTGAKVETIGRLSVGVYTLNITDENLCTSSADVEIFDFDPCSFTFDIDNIDCYGDATGEIMLDFSIWTEAPVVTWQHAATGTHITGLDAGTYYFTATSTGCTLENIPLTVTQNPELDAYITTTGLTDEDENDATATVHPSGGATPYTYKWTTGAEVEHISNLAVGPYSVVITDKHGCSITRNTEIFNLDPCRYTISHADATCYQTNDGTVTVDFSAWSSAPSILWNNGSRTVTINELYSGTYSFVASNEECSESDQVFIDQPSRVTVSITPVNTEPGQATGQATANAGGGTAGYTYEWSNGESGQTISGLSLGTYTVTATDAEGCTATENTTIREIDPCTEQITISQTIVGESCNAGADGSISLNVTGAGGNYTYVWNTGNIENYINNLSAGTYSVTVSDADGDCASKTASINVPGGSDNIDVSYSVIPTPADNCLGEISFTPNRSNLNLDYNWHFAPGNNVSSLDVLCARYYTIDISDDRGCSKTFTINVPYDNDCSNTITSNITPNTDGQCDGGISINMSGYTDMLGMPDPVAVSNPTNCNSCTNSLQGTNGAYINDGQTYCITEGTSLSGTITIENGTLIVCGSIPYGQIDLQNQNATVYINGSAACNINNNGGTLFNFGEMIIGDLNSSNLVQNNANMVVNGNFNLWGNASIVNNGYIKVVNQITMEKHFTNNYIAELTGISCYNGSITNNGFLKVTNDLLTQTPLANTGRIQVLGNSSFNGYNGTYNGVWGSVLETQNFTASGSTINGNSSNPAVIDINGSASLGWNTFFAGNININTIAPQAGVTIGADVNILSNDNDLYEVCDITWTGGYTGYELSNLCAGTYSANLSCPGVECGNLDFNFEVRPATSLTITGSSSDIAICEVGGTANINITVNGGIAPYTYTWSGAGISNSYSEDQTGLGIGTYTVVVADNQPTPYTATKTFTISQSDQPISLSFTHTDACIGNPTGSVRVTASPSTGTYAYLWNNSATTQTLSNIASGYYYVTVTDVNTGCTGDDSWFVGERECVEECIGFDANARVLSHVSVQGGNDGSVYISVDGGNRMHTFQNPNSLDFNRLYAGTYTITVMEEIDGKTCDDDVTFTINDGPVVPPGTGVCTVRDFAISSTDVTCHNAHDGTITIDTYGEELTKYNFVWNGSSLGKNTYFSGLDALSYEVQIIDPTIANCNTILRTTINQPARVRAYAETDIICPGDETTLNVNYTNVAWTGPNGFSSTGSRITVSDPGTYTMTVYSDDCANEVQEFVIIEDPNCNDNVLCERMPTFTDSLGLSCHLEIEAEAEFNARYQYNVYINRIKKEFRENYISACLASPETLTMTTQDKEYHRTLYYYDLAGNLIKTVPPKGVRLVEDLAQVASDREQDVKNVYTDHTMESKYEYNSLNQLIGQNIPDHDPMVQVYTNDDIYSNGIPDGLELTSLQIDNNGTGFLAATDADGESLIFWRNDANSSWQRMSAVGVEDLNDVQVIDNNIAVAVGNNGTFLKTEDAGLTWTSINTETTSDFQFVHFYTDGDADFNNNMGVAYTANGNCFISYNGGYSWEATTRMNIPSSAQVTEIEFVDNSTAYATVNVNNAGRVYKSTDGGETWSVDLQNNVKPITINDVCMVNSNIGYAVGEYGKVIRTIDGGTTWTNVSFTNNNDIQKVNFTSEYYGFVISEGTMYYTDNGGQSWNASITGVQTYTIDPDTEKGIIVTSDRIYKTTDGGITTQEQGVNIPGVPAYETGLYSAAFDESMQLIVVGSENGKLYMSQNSGYNWILLTEQDPLNNPYSGFAAEHINIISASEITVNFADRGMFHLALDLAELPYIEAATEAQVVIADGMSATDGNYFSNVNYISETEGYALLESTPANNTLYKTEDAGQNWEYTNVSVHQDHTKVHVSSELNVMVGTDGIIELMDKTAASPAWTDVSAHYKALPLHGMYADAAGNIAAVGEDGSVLVNVSGVWKEQKTESSSIINDITFNTSTSQYKAVGNSATVLISTNGIGGVWERPIIPLNYSFIAIDNVNGTEDYVGTDAYTNGNKQSGGDITADLNEIDLGSSSFGIAVGDAGKIFRYNGTHWNYASDMNEYVIKDAEIIGNTNIAYAVSEDGTMVKSTDGGRTWSATQVNMDYDLRAADFVDATHGVVVGQTISTGNAVILTTTDGGQSYTSATINDGGFGTAGVNDIQMYDAENGVAVGDNGYVYLTSNSGSTWNSYTLDTDNLYAIDIYNSNKGVVVGAGGSVWAITDIATTSGWTEAIWGSANQFVDVKLLDAVVGYAITEAGKVYKTEDGGNNWEEQTGMESSESLNFMAFTGDNTFVLAGDNSQLQYVRDEKGKYSSKYWYDELGRLIASQNAKQFGDGTTAKSYSYTKYDNLGRIIEVGELVDPNPIASYTSASMESQLPGNQFTQWLATGTKRQITRTYYDYPMSGIEIAGFTQENLRTRVASVTYTENQDEYYQSATHYSYDIHGNVNVLIQDLPELADLGQQYKRVDYDYDLVSSNVNMVSYQEGYKDQMFHKYTYDTDNRIQQVLTSNDGYNWDIDARYEYYRHGPLARTEIGTQKVQAIDYAYTIQGWLKGVNSPDMAAANDIGAEVEGNDQFAPDEFGFNLGYYQGDYSAINKPNYGITTLTTPEAAGTVNPLGTGNSLYNGNISNMITGIRAIDGDITMGHGMSYSYDQLNRLRKARSHTHDGTEWISGDDYAVDLTYDANGNIKSLKRNATVYNDGQPRNIPMDDLSYEYYELNEDEPSASTYTRNTNRLRGVEDIIPAGAHTNDIDDQTEGDDYNGNYTYDQIGNLKKDESEHIASIEWNVSGKITKVVKDNEYEDLAFTYDASGNRLTKTVYKKNSTTLQINPEETVTTYYVRDASGNIMATYNKKYTNLGSNNYTATLSLNEQTIYGSSRLGVKNSDGVELASHTFEGVVVGNDITVATTTQLDDNSEATDDYLTHYLGFRRFEGANHLGNVLTVFSDRKLYQTDGLTITSSSAEVITASDYYPFGMQMVNRVQTGENGYRFGFNGQEKDDNLYGKGNTYSAQYWMYDSRLGRRWNLDPNPQITFSDYSCFENNPLWLVDEDGDSPISVLAKMVLKQGAKAALKKYAKTQIQRRLKRYMSKKMHKQFLKDMNDVLEIVDSEWWEIGLELIPVAGDVYGATTFGIKVAKAWDKLQKLENKYVEKVYKSLPDSQKKKFKKAMRNAGVRDARKDQKAGVSNGDKYTGDGTVDGHHKKRVADDPSKMSDPSNIEFMKKEKHKKWHEKYDMKSVEIEEVIVTPKVNPQTNTIQ